MTLIYRLVISDMRVLNETPIFQYIGSLPINKAQEA